MLVPRRVGSVAASLGLAAISLVGPLATVAPASAGTSVTTGAGPAADTQAIAAVERFGNYLSLGTCNYWRYAVQATGRPTSACFEDWGLPTVSGRWYFYAY